MEKRERTGKLKKRITHKCLANIFYFMKLYFLLLYYVRSKYVINEELPFVSSFLFTYKYPSLTHCGTTFWLREENSLGSFGPPLLSSIEPH